MGFYWPHFTNEETEAEKAITFPKVGSSGGGLWHPSCLLPESVGISHTLGLPRVARGGWRRRQSTARHLELQTVALFPIRNWIGRHRSVPLQRWSCRIPQKRQSSPFSVWPHTTTEGLPSRAGLSTGQRWERRHCADRQTGRERSLQSSWAERSRLHFFSPSLQADNPPPPSRGNEWGKQSQRFLTRCPQRKFRGLWNWRGEKLLLYCHWTLSDLLTSSWNLAFPPVMKGGNKPDLHEQYMWFCRQ